MQNKTTSGNTQVISRGPAFHKDHCPCKGTPQPVSDRLGARQKEISTSGHHPLGNGKTGFFRKPGSQNRKK